MDGVSYIISRKRNRISFSYLYNLYELYEMYKKIICEHLFYIKK